ncbi:MAG TPA: hypothetical protein VMD29_13415 [Terracidiphilus sp.]|nr:hypothetical protein [Terracidiphilus sp.]
MFSSRSFALALAVLAGAALSAPAQESSSTAAFSVPTYAGNLLADASAGSQQQPSQQGEAQQAPANPNQGSQSVQERIRQRRAARRAQAIKDVYSHLYEGYVGMGYMRFVPGPNQQRTTMYAWNAEFTRYYSERFGVTLDGRGNYGTAYVGINPYNQTRPSIAFYSGMLGPTYRFLLHPRYSVSGRAMAGYAHSDFSGDTNGFGTQNLGLYPDGGTYSASVSIAGEYNLSNNLGLRLAPEYDFTGFGSTLQASRGFTGGFVFRFGKQQ